MFSYRDIASAIKDLLDAVNDVLKNCQNVGKMPQYKRVCVELLCHDSNVMNSERLRC